MKYPSDPIISTPSYPPSRASAAHSTYASIWRRTPRSDSARGLNGLIGAFSADAETLNGWYA